MSILGSIASTIIGVGTTGGFGAITGLFGAVITGYTSYKKIALKIEEKKEDHNFQIRLADAESKNMIAESEASIQVLKEETRGKEVQGELAAFLEAQKSESKLLFDKSYMQYFGDGKFGSFVRACIAIPFAFTDVMKSSVRWVLTFYTVGLATWATYLCWEVMQAAGIPSIDATTASLLFKQMLYFIIYMASSVWHFWFVDRKIGKNMDKIFGLK